MKLPSRIFSKSRGIGGSRVRHISAMERRFRISEWNTCRWLSNGHAPRREVTHLLKSHSCGTFVRCVLGTEGRANCLECESLLPQRGNLLGLIVRQAENAGSLERRTIFSMLFRFVQLPDSVFVLTKQLTAVRCNRSFACSDERRTCTNNSWPKLCSVWAEMVLSGLCRPETSLGWVSGRSQSIPPRP